MLYKQGVSHSRNYIQALVFWGLGGKKVPRLVYVMYLLYAMLYPHPPNVQIYSQNLFLKYYIFILFCFISLALTKLHFLHVPQILEQYLFFLHCFSITV